MNHFEQLLRHRGLRSTQPRRVLFEVLTDARAPLSFAEVARKASMMDRTTVYRNLEMLASIGVVQVTFVGWKRRYELAEPFIPHHHHAVCRQCGAIIDIASDELEAVMRSIEQGLRFTDASHTIEIKGLCEACASD